MPDATPDPLPQTLNDAPPTRQLSNNFDIPTAGDATEPHSDAGLLPSRWPIIPGYEILGELGRGGMGVVYKARQSKADRVVALKMILSSRNATLQDRVRFRIEAEAVARLQHRHIVQLHDVGELQVGGDDLPFFSLEFVDGGSLDKKLNGEPMPPCEAAALTEKLARAMHYAHTRGVVHRDLKPGNVLLTADGEPKVTDFGLAKRIDDGSDLSRTGTILGTPFYMAPEQAEGRVRDVGPGSDVWSLGAILYELLTGTQPFKAESVHAVLQQVVKQDPTPPRQLQAHLSADLETICLKCLHKEPGRRYASAEKLADDLHRFLAGEPIHARPVGWVERLTKWVKRRPAIASLAAVSILAAVALLVLGVWYNGRLSDEHAKLEKEQAKTVQERDEANRQRALAEKAEENARQQAALSFLAFARACGLAGRLATHPRQLTESARSEFRSHYHVLILVGNKEVIAALNAFDARLEATSEQEPADDLKTLSLKLAHACRDHLWRPIEKDYPRIAEQIRNLIFEQTYGVVDQLARADLGPDSLRLRQQFWELYWGAMGIVENEKISDVMVDIGKVLDKHRVTILPEKTRKELQTLSEDLRKECGLKQDRPSRNGERR